MFLTVLLLLMLVLLHYIGYRMINNIEPYIPTAVTSAIQMLQMQIASKNSSPP